VAAHSPGIDAPLFRNAALQRRRIGFRVRRGWTLDNPLSQRTWSSLTLGTTPLNGTVVPAARFGVIDRRIQDVSSKPDMLCTSVTIDS
jgi:hypothetical protein